MKMDKFIVKASKRKRRRTRKNLDEIRKRTLQVHNNHNNENMICELVKSKTTHCITNSRLTLANKMIRSETVTRSLLSNLDKEKKTNMILLPTREAIDTKVNVNNKKETIAFKVNSILKSPLCNYKEMDKYKTPDGIILFSSSESGKLLNNITINDVLSDSSSSAALTFVTQSESNTSLYNEFMTNIVNYVQESASDFFKIDTVHKYKDSLNFLQNVIYNKTKKISSPQSHMNKYDVKTKLSNPGNDEAISQYPNCQNNVNIQYTLKQTWNDPSPFFHQSHGINLQKCISSSSSACPGQDSPEYFYYPHRLNQ